MFYKIGGPHGLPHDPFKSCVVPRPIVWISTIGADDAVNLAPYSFFNAVATEPPMVMFSSNGKQAHGTKDSVANAEATGEFVCNMATWDLREEMNLSCAALGPEVDEFAFAGLETAPSELVAPPRVKAAPIHMECIYHQTIELPSRDPSVRNAMVLGRVVGIHISDDVLTDGLVDASKFRPIARLGYMDYARVDEVFAMRRPVVETVAG